MTTQTLKRLLTVSSTLICAGSALADVNFTTSIRTVHGQGGFASNYGSTLAPSNTASNHHINTDVGQWSDTIINAVPSYDGRGYAGQNSDITPSAISGGFMAESRDGSQTSTGVAFSTLSTTFSVDVPTAYTLTGSWGITINQFSDPYTQGSGSATISLSGSNGFELGSSFSFPLTAGSGSLSATDILPVGSYTLTVDVARAFPAIQGGFNGSVQSSLNFNLAFAPAPTPSVGGIMCVGLGFCSRRRTR